MRKIFIALLTVFITTTFFACDNETTTTQQTTFTTNVSTNIETTERVLVEKDVSQYVTYNFRDDITIEEQNSFIEGNELNLQYFLMRDFYVNDHIEFYISRDSDNVYAEKNQRIFLDLDEYNTFEALFCITQAFNSRYANYGLMYGMAYFVAEALGYETFDFEHSEQDTFTYLKRSDNVNHFDITFPCFYNEYSSKLQIEYSTDFSVYITEFIIRNNDVFIFNELLKETDLSIFEEKFTTYKNQWFNSLSSNFHLATSEYPKAFATEHLYNTLEWITESSKYELREGYFYHEGLEQYSLNDSYEYLVNGIDAMEADMDMMDEILKDETYDYPELHIVLDPGVRGWYNLTGDVLVGGYSAFLHEYVHYLTMQIMDTYATRIMYEWVACYYSNYSVFFDESITEELLLNYEYNRENSILNQIDFEDNDEFNYSKDWQKIINYQLAYNQDYIVLTLDHYRRVPLTSYVIYLIDLCGSEEAFYEVMKDNSLLENYTSKTFEELVEDWIEYHQENYITHQ